ncbi:CoA transferase [Nocardioides sp. Iso805N]|uniref:CoA transferase n=1 Tax=Nocardioides sp. Iso805N TaxID=1283287 RepID=UPI00037ABC61|nr:CoA transferase [Nocardioides sp. Iso805N]
MGITPAGPLDGLRIVELSSYIATPLCGLALAQLGAEVIRVEQIGGAPDRSRLPRAAGGTSMYWSGLNKGKRALAVDLASQAGRDLVADLIVGEGTGTAGGIVVSNSERYRDLTFAGLRERRSDVIHVLLTGRRDGGSAVDYTVQAETGFPFVSGPLEAANPVNSQVPAWDIAAGLYLATGLLAAERERAATGLGQQVRLALEDVALSAIGAMGFLTEAQLGGISRGPSGNYVYGTYGHDFVSLDGVRFMLVVLTASHWRGLLDQTGLVDAMAAVEKALEVDLSDEAERYRNRAVITALLQGRFATLPWADVVPLLARSRALASPYRTFDQVVASDMVRANPLFSEVDQPGIGPHLAAGSPLVMAGRQGPAVPAPSVGEHTDEIVGALPGIDADRLQTLYAEGVIA